MPLLAAAAAAMHIVTLLWYISSPSKLALGAVRWGRGQEAVKTHRLVKAAAKPVSVSSS